MTQEVYDLAVHLLGQIDAALAALNDASVQLKAIVQQQIAPAPHLLSVPWLSQLGPDAAYSNSDCGPADVAMWLRLVGKIVSVDDVSKATGLSAGYHYTIPAQLIAAAGHYGLSLMRIVSATIDQLHAEIDAGRPIIVLVHYASLPARYDANFTAGHWLLVIGYTDTEIIYHDPYWPDTRGQAIHCPIARFEHAMRDCGIDGNSPNQALIQVVQHG